jgi:hypothetical protein
MKELKMENQWIYDVHAKSKEETVSGDKRERGRKERLRYLVLEEALVEVFPESVIEGGAGLLPVHGEGELERRAGLKNNRVLRGKVDLDDLSKRNEGA